MLKVVSSKHRMHNFDDEYNNALYDPQYPDDNTDGGVQLDHKKLYITNLPKGLNEEGLECLLTKYGGVSRIHLSRDPLKRYAIVTFEDPSGARAAMMKLNKTEPLRLVIRIAHKKNNQDHTGKDQKPSRNFDRRSTIDESDGVGSTARRSNHWIAEEHIEQYEEELLDDNIGLEDDDMDLEVKLELLKLQEAEIKIKQRRLLLNQPKKLNQQSNRCILADGRIVVRNIDRNHEPPEVYSSAGGDSYTLPALQRESSRACVSCGAPADAYCARCGLVPYCGARCQRADWNNRHHGICHNLARMADGPLENKTVAKQPIIPPAQSLRRPLTPNRPASNANSRETRSEDADSQKKSQSRDSKGQKHRLSLNNRNSPRNQNSGRLNMGQNDTRPDADEEESFEPKDSKLNQPKKLPESPATKPEPVAANPAPVVVKPVPVAAQLSPVVTNPGPVPLVSKPQPLRQPHARAESETRLTAPAVAPASVDDVTPTRRITPKKYLPETLSIGSEVLLSVETEAKTRSRGFVCLALHESSAAQYQMLCEDYGLECEANTEKFKPSPGETFSYLNPEDGAWYRARCLGPTSAAFIDSGLTVSSLQPNNCRRLPDKYDDIVEFCCQLDAEGIKLGDNLSCKLVEKVGESFKVTLSRDGEDIGTGELFRWLPPVELPVAPAAVVLPEVPRPAVCAGAVLLVEGGAEGAGQAFVRPATDAATRAHDGLLEDVLLHGLQGHAVPLKEPPQKGDLVVGKFTDGNFYRALCKRTSVRQNKYMLEYVEYGNVEISRLEDLYECPPQFDLTTRPTMVSMVKLPLTAASLSAEAVEYLEKLRDDCTELTLTLPNGATTAPSGSEVTLTVAKTRENVNQRLDELSIPEWKKTETNGVDTAETAPIMFSELRYLELAAGELEVLDASMLAGGLVSACPARHPDVLRVLGELSDQITEYCNSEIGSLPYLPRPEETCIAECPKSGRWMRAVMCAQEGGAGGSTASVCFLDRGDVDAVPVLRLRRILPAFLRLPVLSSLLKIIGFPEDPTPEMVSRAAAHLRLGADGRGRLTVTRCERVDGGVYDAHAPDLLRAMGL